MGFWQKFFNPYAYIGAIILMILGLSPTSVTEWLASHISPDLVSFVSGDKGRWTFVAFAALLLLEAQRRHHNEMRKKFDATLKERAPALSSPMMPITDIAAY